MCVDYCGLLPSFFFLYVFSRVEIRENPQNLKPTIQTNPNLKQCSGPPRSSERFTCHRGACIQISNIKRTKICLCTMCREIMQMFLFSIVQPVHIANNYVCNAVFIMQNMLPWLILLEVIAVNHTVKFPAAKERCLKKNMLVVGCLHMFIIMGIIRILCFLPFLYHLVICCSAQIHTGLLLL